MHSNELYRARLEQIAIDMTGDDSMLDKRKIETPQKGFTMKLHEIGVKDTSMYSKARTHWESRKSRLIKTDEDHQIESFSSYNSVIQEELKEDESSNRRDSISRNEIPFKKREY